MKLAAVTAFLGVIVFLMLSGEMPLELITASAISVAVTALVIGACCALISIYFDKNFDEDGAPRSSKIPP